jgi:protein phosphatase
MNRNPGDSDNFEIEIEMPVDVGSETAAGETVPDKRQSSRLNLRGALRSHVGAVRERNEDSCLMVQVDSGGHASLPAFGLYLVADGMGGYEGGDRASKIAAHTAAQQLVQRIYLPMLNERALPERAAVDQIMRESVLAAHQAVHPPGYAGNGGTTLTIALVLDQQLYVAHVGDSRAYWLVNGDIQALTRDHSLVQRLQDEGKLTVEEAENFQYRNVLLRALGQDEDLEVDLYTYALPSRGKLLLCSDGLSGQISDPDIARIMNRDLSADQIADELLTAALKAGGLDNISAVVVEFES